MTNSNYKQIEYINIEDSSLKVENLLRALQLFILLVCIQIFFTPTGLGRPKKPDQTHHSSSARVKWTIWNVKQGLWISERRTDGCRHFDMGGEQAPWKVIRAHCAHGTNSVLFSHWDWDHVRFASQAARKLPNFCVALPPAGPAKASRRRLLAKLSNCPLPTDHSINHSSGNQLEELNKDNRANSANDASRVFLLAHHVLLPGDSTSAQEAQWSKNSDLTRVTHLVLGHHGSLTSTSSTLLARTPKLRQAIASARTEKYGHPHPKVLEALKRAGVAVLETEDWGSIHIESIAPQTQKTQRGLRTR